MFVTRILTSTAIVCILNLFYKQVVTMITIAVVEDEKEYSDVLLEYIARFSKETHIAVNAEVFGDGASFIDEYSPRFDIVLMDIAMPHLNGMEAAKRLREKDKTVCLIFITTLANYAIRGYEVNALDFLVKPPTYELFKIKLEKAIAVSNKNAELTYTIAAPTEMRRVPLSEIIYIESNKHYLIFHTISGEFRMRSTMREVTEFFTTNGFAFLSGSLLVNLTHVDSFKGNDISICGEVLPITRIYKAAFLQALAKSVGGGK